MECQKCGRVIMEKDTVCPYCGEAIDQDNPTSSKCDFPQSVYGISTESLKKRELIAFVAGKDKSDSHDDEEYYLKKWSKALVDGKSKAGFNFAAAFFGPNWAFYRKSYSLAIAYYIFELSVAFIGSTVFMVILGLLDSDGYEPLAFILSFIIARSIFGSFANVAYLKRALKTINKYKSEGFLELQLTEKLNSAGGTSFLPLAIGMAIQITISLFIRVMVK